MQKWNSEDPSQQILPDFESYFPDKDVYALDTRNGEVYVTRPDLREPPPWMSRYRFDLEFRLKNLADMEIEPWKMRLREALMSGVQVSEHDLAAFWTPEEGLMLDGRPVFMELAVHDGEDRAFIYNLETAREDGGGVVIYIDPQDDYRTDRDRGYHYALLGLDIRFAAPGTELAALLDDEEERWIWAGHIMPLPMLAERLGFVKLDEMVDEEDILTGDVTTELSLDFWQMVQFLYETFEGRVRFGLRIHWDSLFHEHRMCLPWTEENLAEVFSGPLVPHDWDDEERLAHIKEWLLQVNELFSGMYGGLVPLSFLECLFYRGNVDERPPF
jgi:hypothetical protein